MFYNLMHRHNIYQELEKELFPQKLLERALKRAFLMSHPYWLGSR